VLGRRLGHAAPPEHEQRVSPLPPLRFPSTSAVQLRVPPGGCRHRGWDWVAGGGRHGVAPVAVITHTFGGIVAILPAGAAAATAPRAPIGMVGGLQRRWWRVASPPLPWRRGEAASDATEALERGGWLWGGCGGFWGMGRALPCRKLAGAAATKTCNGCGGHGATAAAAKVPAPAAAASERVQRGWWALQQPSPRTPRWAVGRRQRRWRSVAVRTQGAWAFGVVERLKCRWPTPRFPGCPSPY